jgi:surfeit locus 1 family protein
MAQSNESPVESRSSLVIDIEWRLTLFTVLLLPLLISLGFWQLSRAEEKRVLEARHEQRAAMPAADIATLLTVSAEERADRRIAINAEFERGNYLLLDNRIRSGRVGYEVVALVVAGTPPSPGWIVPVNLGWVAGDPARRTLPDISLPAGEASITGRIYVPSAEAYVLSDEAFPTELPAVVQALPLDRWMTDIADRSARPVFPHIVRIDENSPVAYAADWPIVNQSPAKHTGYAVQWFTMAAVLLVAYVLRSTNLWSLLKRRS